MVCNIIDECRCYAYSDVYDVKRNQFCGVRRGSHIEVCPPDCCAGGCPGQNSRESREPFRVIDRPSRVLDKNDYMILFIIASALVLLTFMT
jgi:hypothetical protein